VRRPQPISASAHESKQIVCHHLVHEGASMRQQGCPTKRAWERMRMQTQMAVSDMEIHGRIHQSKRPDNPASAVC
jgi:hypothetical protein